MKTLYLDCNMGAAGDMLMAALLELVPAPDSFVTRLGYLGIPGVKVTRESSVKCGITGTHLSVTVGGIEEESADAHGHSHSHGGHTHSHGGHTHSHADGEGEHTHGSMEETEQIITALPVSKWVQQSALSVYRLIAEAESKVHGVPVSQVHFHEVGSMDAIADIVGVCMLLEELAPDKIVASPVHVGSGQVHCAHGILPVPAPATADILRGIPCYGGEVKGELCTPTGAALLRHFVTQFGSMPPMTMEKIGYGMGKKDFEAANCVRAILGRDSGEAGANDCVTELCCNLDDMTGEAIGFACEQLLQGGALDVFTLPIVMKKSRPGQLLTCIVKPEDADRIAALLLRHTTTFGVRRRSCDRYILDRHMEELATPYGSIRVKTGRGYGVEKSKPEYEDLALAARQAQVSIGEVLQSLWGTGGK
ncbi:MAG: nickel pincer cofactor biosynthesis protein LarC [Angelakisella sp.]